LNILGIKKRFDDLLSDKFLIIAALSHPSFKTAWIKDDVKKELAVGYFKKACLDEFKEKALQNEDNTFEIETVEKNVEDPSSNFFQFWSQTSDDVYDTVVNKEIDQYIGTSPTKDINSLNHLPTIKKVRIITDFNVCNIFV